MINPALVVNRLPSSLLPARSLDYRSAIMDNGSRNRTGRQITIAAPPRNQVRDATQETKCHVFEAS